VYTYSNRIIRIIMARLYTGDNLSPSTSTPMRTRHRIVKTAQQSKFSLVTGEMLSSFNSRSSDERYYNGHNRHKVKLL